MTSNGEKGMGRRIGEGAAKAARSPYRFLIAAAILAAVFCLLPVEVDAPQGKDVQRTAQEEGQTPRADAAEQPGVPGVPAGADLSERTQEGAYLHRTVLYTPCGHSVQRRERLTAALVGLSRTALEADIGSVLPGARVTGFSAQEVDVTLEMDMPCPLHWVLKAGENGYLQVLQNTTGEALGVVRETQIKHANLDEDTRAQLLDGVLFDEVQQLEGYLENLDS